jgi:tetratricopeptide (TPR) repeat protein
LREQSRFAEAIEVLKSLTEQHPGEPRLWDSLGAVLSAQGDNATALVFFSEALRLAPDDLHARFHRGCALLDSGETRAGIVDVVACAEGFTDPDNRASAAITAGQAYLSLGDLDNGWQWYAARHRLGATGEVHYDLDLARYEPGASLDGKRIFISAEQGLGDEVLFGTVLPDIVSRAAALGIGVEPRLVSLFQRSFSRATVVAHRTRTENGRIIRAFPGLDTDRYDMYGLMGDVLPVLRATVADFPPHNAYLAPDPARIAHWQAWLASISAKPRIGILWKSLKFNAQRDRYFAPFSEWLKLLDDDRFAFINLQYGDSAAEQAAAGTRLFTPSGIDLKDDLDDLAALCRACDLVVGPSNATTNIAAACGVPTWILSTPGTWLNLGQGSHNPWYPSARLFTPPSLSDWAQAFADIADALEQYMI